MTEEYPQFIQASEVEKAAAYVARGRAESFRDSMAAEDVVLESPIEGIFYVWWHAVVEATSGADPMLDELLLVVQPEVDTREERYRLDFSVALSDARLLADAAKFGLPLPQIGIELDGHDFHERTKEQVTHRNRRDRHLQRSQWVMFHFSGSELFRDPVRCVHEVTNYAVAAYMALWSQIYDLKQQAKDAPPA
jgi:hypothetical protein